MPDIEGMLSSLAEQEEKTLNSAMKKHLQNFKECLRKTLDITDV